MVKKVKRREKMIKIRNKRGLLQRDVVELLRDYGFSITTSYYGMIEQGVRTPKIHLAIAIAHVLKADPTEIFFEDQNNRLLRSRKDLEPTGTEGGN